MKKILKFFLLSIFAVSTAYCETHQARTFLMPRPHGVNLAMELATFHDHIFLHKTNKFNSHVQVTPFYQAAIKGEDVGKYFGIGNGRNYFNVGNPATAGTEVENIYLIHKYDAPPGVAAASTLAGTTVFNPKQEAFGVRLDYFQFMKHPLKNTFLKISIPIVYVENDMHFKVDDSVADANSNYLHNFFRGDNITQADAQNTQSALTHAKIGGRRSSAGVADVDIAIGYRLVEKENKHLYIHAGLTAPTGTRVTGEWLFEPVYGNGRHVALGWGIDGSIRLWKKERHWGRLIVALNHRYLFDGTEKRTIPLKSQFFPFAHYYLAFEKNKAGLLPAANILTQDFTVRPGNQIDSMIALSFKTKRFLVDLGYNLFFKEGESLTLKNWVDETYAIAFTTRHSGTIQANTNDSVIKMNLSNLDIGGAATPSQLTHKAFGAIGYKFNIDRYPSSIAFGGSYEFATANHELEGYAFWGKFGISF